MFHVRRAMRTRCSFPSGGAKEGGDPEANLQGPPLSNMSYCWWTKSVGRVKSRDSAKESPDDNMRVDRFSRPQVWKRVTVVLQLGPIFTFLRLTLMSQLHQLHSAWHHRVAQPNVLDISAVKTLNHECCIYTVFALYCTFCVRLVRSSMFAVRGHTDNCSTEYYSTEAQSYSCSTESMDWCGCSIN